MKWLISVISIVAFVLPISASAAVVINEIAWAGTAVSANDEWIELYNSGATSIDLSGWLIEAADGAPSISLSGMISPGGFFLLERTDDDSVLGIAADQIYTGALGNTGEVLRLFDNAGTQVDVVDGSGSWSIGGDSSSRKTLQRNGSGWITADGTPRTANSTVDTAPAATEEDESGDTSDDTNNGDGSVEDPVDVDIVSETKKDIAKEKKNLERFEIFKNRNTILAGSPVVFSGKAFDQHKDRLWNVSYIWNFGDGGIAEGDEVVHTWNHPGNYVVAVTCWKGNNEIVQKLTVTVRESNVYISDYEPGLSGFIEIQNDTSSEINISQWSVQSGANIRLIPHNTFVAKNSSIRLYVSELGFSVGAKPLLRYPGGGIVPEPQPEQSQTISAQVASVIEAPLFQSAEAAEENVEVVTATPDKKETTRFITPESVEKDSIIWWIAGLIALIGVAAVTVMLLTREERVDYFDEV